MKIGLAGLCKYENYGDQIIGRTVEYLVKKMDESIDVNYISFERERSGYNYVVCTALLKLVKLFPNCNLKYKLQYSVYRMRMEKYFQKEIEDISALIFVAGSFKYGTQNLWAMYSLLVDCCQKKNIPVMFDAMNIQKYNEKDWRCLELKRHANMPCVKMITTRDGLPGVVRLKQDYIVNGDVCVYPVGDPAFWTADLFEVQKKRTETVGINLIRTDAFKNYGGYITEESVIEAYAGVIKELSERGTKWEFFTNGLKADLTSVDEIIEKAGLYREDIVIRIPDSAKSFVNIVSNYHYVLGARLHACIVAYSLGIPCSGFCWDEKLTYFAEEIEAKELFCDEENFSAEELLDKLKKATEFHYAPEVKTKWKQTTLETIWQFIKDCD